MKKYRAREGSFFDYFRYCDSPNFTAAIEYETEEAWKNMICADCQHWDDGNSIDSVMGLCHECGGRKRFNNTACDKFNDVRG